MKKIILSLTAVAALTIACKKTENASSKINEENVENVNHVNENENAIIGFDSMEYDFGELKKGEKASHEFVITNTGTTDLVIIDAKASCGCTVPEKPTAPIKPGESANMKVVFSANSVGKANKTITVTSNANETRSILGIKATVVE